MTSVPCRCKRNPRGHIAYQRQRNPRDATLRPPPRGERQPADAAVIDGIRALDLPIAVCAGCIIQRSTAAALLP